MEDHGDGRPRGHARGCGGCGQCRTQGDGYDAASCEALEGIAARFGDAVADAVHGVLHDPDDRWVPGPLPWPWSGRDASGQGDALQAAVDAGSPGIDLGTLRSLTRLWGVMTGMDRDPYHGDGTRRIALMRCLSLIMTAGLTDRRPKGHASADAYAAAAIIGRGDAAARPVRVPGLGVDDISGLIRDVRRAYGGGWTGMHSQTVNDDLAALTVMRLHGAPVAGLTRIIDALMDDSALMGAVMADGRKADAGCAETVLALHERTGGDPDEEKRIIGWNGHMDGMAVRRGRSGKAAAAMAAAAMRLEDGNAADPLTGPGKAAMGRAVALMSEASRKTAVRGMDATHQGVAMDALDVIMTGAAGRSWDDPDAMDMIVSIARFCTMIDHDRTLSAAGPLLKAGRPGVEALADGVRMLAEGLPEGFVAETTITLCAMIGDHGPDFAKTRLGSRLSTMKSCGKGS